MLWIFRVICTIWGVMLGASSVFAQTAETMSEEKVASQPVAVAMPVEIVAIDLEPLAELASPRLRLRVQNRSTATLAAWTLEVRVDGEVLAAYRDLLIMQPVEPGETASLELYRLSSRASSLRLEIKVLEAWTAEQLDDDQAAKSSWRLLEPLEGEPVSAEIFVQAAATKP